MKINIQSLMGHCKVTNITDMGPPPPQNQTEWGRVKKGGLSANELKRKKMRAGCCHICCAHMHAQEAMKRKPHSKYLRSYFTPSHKKIHQDGFSKKSDLDETIGSISLQQRPSRYSTMPLSLAHSQWRPCLTNRYQLVCWIGVHITILACSAKFLLRMVFQMVFLPFKPPDRIRQACPAFLISPWVHPMLESQML